MSKLTFILLLIYAGIIVFFAFLIIRGILSNKKEKQNKELEKKN